MLSILFHGLLFIWKDEEVVKKTMLRREDKIKVQLKKNYVQKEEGLKSFKNKNKKQISFSKLSYSSKDTPRIAKAINVDGYKVRNKCLTNIVQSIGSYPDAFFHNGVTGSAVVKVNFFKDFYRIDLVESTHQLVGSLICLQTKNVLNDLKDLNCLRNIKKPLSFYYRFTLKSGSSHKGGFSISSNGWYHKEIARLSKTSLLRIPMAISNLFTLLELYEDDDDKTSWLNLKRRLLDFSCKGLRF